MSLIALTNPVTALFVADAVVAVTGQTPIMSHSVGELPAWRPHIQSIYINLGAFDPQRRAGADWLSRQTLPFVLDPVGITSDSSRLAFAKILLARKPSLVRGNASEIAALFDVPRSSHAGIDSYDDAGIIASLVQPTCPVLISGVHDYLIDNSHCEQDCDSNYHAHERWYSFHSILDQQGPGRLVIPLKGSVEPATPFW